MSDAFETPFPPGHFVRDYLDYAAERTDASHAYHEVAALVLLALATPNVRASLTPYPNGLPTNLYALVVGDSTRSRKSTAISLAADIASAAIAGSRIPDAFSPEAFAEALAQRPRDSTLWTPDEFGETMTKLRSAKYMSGLTALLLTIYAGNDYEVRRHSKRVKGGGAEEDTDRIEQPNLSILGATTPAIFETLTEAEVTSGLLPRFAIVNPTTKPARKPFYEVPTGIEARRNQLVSRLRHIYDAASARPHTVEFQEGALEALDAFAQTLEESTELNEAVRTMQQRLSAMAVKLAMLSAAGWQDGMRPNEPLRVAIQDGEMAVSVAQRWAEDAKAFAERVGETRFETVLQKCMRIVEAKKAVPRSVIAQNAHVPKKLLDDIEATAIDRKLIEIREEQSPSGPSRVIWTWAGTRNLTVIQGGKS